MTEEEKAKLDAYKVNSIPEPTYGGQLQDISIQGHKAEGQIKIEYKETNREARRRRDGASQGAHYSIVDLGYGPLAEGP